MNTLTRSSFPIIIFFLFCIDQYAIKPNTIYERKCFEVTHKSNLDQEDSLKQFTNQFKRIKKNEMICKAYEILLFLGFSIFFDTKNSHSSYAEFEIQQKLTNM